MCSKVNITYGEIGDARDILILEIGDARDILIFMIVFSMEKVLFDW